MDPNILVMIEKSEANYSSYLIDPLMKIVGGLSEKKNCYYQIGEYKLEAINKEIKRRRDAKLMNTSYNADGCHTSLIGSEFIELSIVEVSGSFSESSQARFTKDHVKAGFGMLSLLQEIGHLFKYGSIDTFSTVQVYFIHALGECMPLVIS